VEPNLYQLLVEQMRDYALFVLDPKGQILTWNAGAQRIKGYAADEIIGEHFSIFYEPAAIERGWPAYELEVAAIEGRFEDEGWRLRKDGSRFWANVVITALRDQMGRLVGYAKITRDLSERKANEEALRQSEERFRLLVEGVVDYAVFMVDPEGVVTSWNAGAERMKGYRAHEVLGRHFSRFYAEEDRQAGKPWETLARAARDSRAEDEGWRMRKDGTRFWARGILTALRDGEGRLRGFAKLTQDLSDRRALMELEQAAQNLNQFVAVLAHELRNPLAPIRNAVQVMASLPPGDPAHEAMRQTIDRQSARLTRIVDDLLDISRITRGKLQVEREQIDLVPVVRSAVETSRPLMEAGRHRLRLELPDGPLLVNGDADRLAQLLSNLLNNAARYTPDPGEITVHARAAGSAAEISVKDTGQGIDPAMLEAIFDMFVQGPVAPRAAGGLGIGLSLARKIAELHGGSLEARSQGVGHGSEFVLRLPGVTLGRPATTDAAQPAEARVPRATPRRVLVVDDNADAARTLARLLESLGHSTAVAHDGEQAVRLATEFRPHIVLLDLGMPGMDGYEVARRLRALQRRRRFRIVAVTGWGQEADRIKSREAGIDLHLAKPLEPGELALALGERQGSALH
jgi:PAS domain S-box-containing protein